MLGFQTTEAQDIVTFHVAGTALDRGWGTNGADVIQSEGAGLAAAEDRGRQVLALPGDRTLHVGRFGRVPAAMVLDTSSALDPGVSGDGVIELPSDTINAQFFGAAPSPDGAHVALTTTNSNAADARLVVLDVQG